MGQARRINFNVDEEERLRVASLLETTRMPSQRDLFMAALDLYERVHREVDQDRRTVMGVPAALASMVAREVARRSGEAHVLAEPTGGSFRWLVTRPGWRSTPWVKGRRLNVSDVIQLIEQADSELEVAEDLGLPAEAIAECQAYFDANRELVEAEDREAASRSRRSVETVQKELGLGR